MLKLLITIINARQAAFGKKTGKCFKGCLLTVQEQRFGQDFEELRRSRRTQIIKTLQMYKFAQLSPKIPDTIHDVV